MLLDKGLLIIGDSRKMIEIEDESIDVIITSPPYWHIKDYGVDKQIGYGQTLHGYLKDLYSVWKECYRVLKPGKRLCINIGDQFARSVVYGRYKVIPLHSEIISQCEEIGFDYMGAIIWQKKTTMNTTGGANIMGSYPYPPNGILEIDYEYILIFKKPGKTKIKVSKEIKEKSKLSKEEWKEYFSGHWNFPGVKQLEHEAMFPEELPRRLIKMFSFVGDKVLDPFVGSGTTMKVALELERIPIGYEINENFLQIIKNKVNNNIKVIKRENTPNIEAIDYIPRIKDAKPQIEQSKLKFGKDHLYKVVEIIDEETLKLNTDLNVKFLGVKIIDKDKALDYFKKYLLKKEVFLKFDSNNVINQNTVEAYVYLKNKIFINAYLIKSGIAKAERIKEHKYKNKFIEIEGDIYNGKRMDT
ncbi:DNA methyltransferase [Venenivibrio stagnispumantis]|uniref:Methyltransferase n=1 Tax=Venenivibrio stagnispumantis TaxID=407998 RepID=A0AA45WK91_9AQUI|nr:DNA methyltransferase [Venenivibrio stagnispumantis]MCW4573507.1 DNA methyltransferase [Venenivibrio stagnispumantis]SMP06398.1 DNA modification methylase [Venenivibrio stagnispumantis]